MALMVAHIPHFARVENSTVESLRWGTQGNSLRSFRRRSQVVRQRSAKPPFVGSIPTGASLSHTNVGPPDLMFIPHVSADQGEGHRRLSLYLLSAVT